jgi:hypothetical protein
MRASWIASSAIVLAFSLIACGAPDPKGNGDGGLHDGQQGPPDACVGLQCMQVDCSKMGGGETTLSGTVYAPNGTLPLYNVTVYVPNSDPGPLPAGATCDRCNDALPGEPVVQTITDEAGHFTLTKVPVSPNLPLIIQVGKWRRQITIPTIAACVDTPLDAQQTRLPKNHTEGDMPQMAITTGGADALECLLPKLGIDPSEFSIDSGPGHVHLYSGNGANKFAAGQPNTGTFSDAKTLWNNPDQLKKYDLVIFSCEGSQPSDTRAPATAQQAVFDYANLGGRIFMSHWHNKWLEQGPAPWPTVATFDNNNNNLDPTQGTIDESFDRGKSFATWMLNVGGSTTRDLLDIKDGRNTCQAVDPLKAQRWVYLDPATTGGPAGVQNLQFTAPLTVPESDRCGKVVFSDMHVSSGSSSKPATAFPGGCATTALTPQEKALAFMFFDIASCVGPIVN